jgi:hypothetical protein
MPDRLRSLPKSQHTDRMIIMDRCGALIFDDVGTSPGFDSVVITGGPSGGRPGRAAIE